jgi:predicted HTH transcriptional regulator
MFTLSDIRRLVASGEGLTLEFKHRAPEPFRLAREAVALANARGGVILFGVDDDGRIVGVKDSEEEEFAIRGTLDRYCAPRLDWHIDRVRISSKRDVLALSVSFSHSKPHSVESPDDSGPGVVYVRVEDMALEASPEAVELMSLEGDETDARFEFGDSELFLLKYLEEYGSVTVEQFARLSGLSEGDARNILVTLTHAGILHFNTSAGGDRFFLNKSRVQGKRSDIV